MQRKEVHLKTANDVASTFNIGVHEIKQILVNDGFRHVYELKDGRILTGSHYDNGMNSHEYEGGSVSLYDNMEEFNEKNDFGIQLEKEHGVTGLMEEIQEMKERREDLLNQISVRVNKREGQHLREIIDEVRSLCSQLERTMA